MSKHWNLIVTQGRGTWAGSVILSIGIFVALASGCASVPERNPLPEALVSRASVPGGEYVRYWGDQPPPYTDDWLALSDEELREYYPAVIGRPHVYLALSGGGDNGAFGAGILCGWTAAGNRPEFTIVTGISTGALTAPFAFLGSDYDDYIRKGYTTLTTKDVLKERGSLNALHSDAAADNQPLKDLIAQLIDNQLMEAIAVEHRNGRTLIIGTTNFDSQRPVHWNIGEIANSGHPQALNLIRQVLIASAAVPAAFPPVLIEVEADGAIYDEMHMDGGIDTQVFIYPAGLDWEKVLEKLDTPGRPKLYIIRNSRIAPRYQAVKNRIFNIGMRAVSSMVRSQGIANLHEIYLKAQRDGLDYNLAYIPGSFTEQPGEPFDPVYMKKLFDLAFEMARNGYPWEPVPPDYNLEAEN